MPAVEVVVPTTTKSLVPDALTQVNSSVPVPP